MRDSGVGISPDLLGKIFELTLAPGISVLSEQQGLQLRLVAAKNLVERHEGRLHAVSEGSGKGSEFVIYLPLERARTTRTDPRTTLRRAIPLTGIATPRASLTQLRMLIVDDSPAVQISLGALVRELGHDVRAAVDGAEALTIARAWLPQVVLLDIHLPTFNGYDVARQLQAHFASEQMILIMMGGDALNDTAVRAAYDAGFDHCVDKMQTRELLETLLNGGT